jgi:hypothetical protein
MARSHFVSCSSCSRHVRASEGACPFCGVSLPVAKATPPAPSSRVSRAALLAFGAGAFMLTPACSSSNGGGESCGPPNCFPPYGAPPLEDAGGAPDGSLVPADAQVGTPDAADAFTSADSGSDGGSDAGPSDATTDGNASPH